MNLLATSGTTSAEGESIGNSWKFSHIVEAFCTQWSDAALAARDAKARKSDAVVAAVDNFDLCESTFLDLTTQTDALMMLGKKESLVRTHEAHEI